MTEVWPEGVDGCCGGGSDGCFDGIFDGGFDSGSFYPVGATLPKRVFLAGSAHAAQPCENGSLGQVPPGPHSCKTLRQNLRQNPQNAVRVETDRSLPVDDQPAIVSEAKIPPPGLEPEPLG